MRKNTKSSISTLNKNQSSHGNSRAWFIFLISLFISTFFGGAIRAFLSPQQLSSWVEKKLTEKNPKFFLNFDQLEFRLADGAWPKFGLYIKGLKLSSKDPCITQSQLTISEVYLPIRFSSFFQRRVSFSDIEADKVEFVFGEPLCNSNTRENVSLTPPTPQNTTPPTVEEQSTIALNAVRSFVENRFLIELNNSRQWFQSLLFKNFHIYIENHNREGILFNNFFVDLNEYDDKLLISTQVSYRSQKYLVEDLKPLALDFTLSKEKIYLKGIGRFKEGELSLHGNLDIPTEEFSIKFESKYFPMGEIIKTFVRKDLTEGWSSRLLWFSCQASAQGLIGDYKNIQIVAKQCGLRGEAGKLYTKELIFYPFMSQHAEPFVAEVEEFSFKYLSEILGGKKLDSTFTDWGKLDGILEYNNNQLRFKGKLKNMEVIFSHKSKKRLQLIREVKGEVSWEKQRVSGIINEMDLAGGEFSGIISFNMDEQFRSGIIQTKVDNLLLNRSVIKLLMDAELTPLQIYGKMSLKNGILEEWQGYLGSAQLSSSLVLAKNIKVDTKYSGNYWDVGLKVETIEVQPSGSFYEKLNRLLIQDIHPDKYSFSKFKMNLKWLDQEGEWKELSTLENEQKILISSSGKVHKNQQISGWINIEKEDKKWMPWEVTGSYSNLEFSPSVKLLKAIRPDNSTVKIDDKMEAQQRIDAFEKIMISRKSLKPKGFTEKIVDSAKKWMPEFKKEKPEETNQKTTPTSP
ncbi:MAG: hypothetical protein H6625_01055 [Bdellovibrionaceae bacterium]|nr:hypothetical protein [Pseudobdellovibrionaceae bacterium]